MALRQDITSSDEFWTGEDKLFEFTVYQAGGVVLQDLSGFTDFRWSLFKTGAAGKTAAFTKALDDGIVGVGANSFAVTVDGEDTAELAGDTKPLYDHEGWGKDAGGNWGKLVYGSVVLKKSLGVPS